MKWITNILKDNLNDDYCKGKIIGLPKATDTYSVKQLSDMGMVGIYKAETSDELKQVSYD